jgi:uncharacterized membrane protein
MEQQRLFLARIDDIQRKLREANYECNQLRELVQQSAFLRPSVVQPPVAPPVAQPKANPVAPPQVHTPPPPQIVPPVAQPVVEPPKVEAPKVEPPKVEPPKVEAPKHELPKVTPPTVKPIAPPVVEQTHVAVAPPATQAAPPPPREPKAPFSLESFIGGNLLNKIGIGILILGIGLFVKYAIDKDWIGPVGRVLIGIASGLALLGVAHALRKKYKAFSSVLVGGGMTTLYLTFALAYHLFGLFSQPVAFGIMCVLTIFTFAFSILYDRKEIAVMALIGGFATPFIVTNGSGNVTALFTYYLILNTGMIALAWFRRWPLINVLSYIVTVLAFAGWHAVAYSFGTFDAHALNVSLGFSVAFFLQFFLMNVAHQVRFRERFLPQDYLMLLSNAFVMFGLGVSSVAQIADGKWMGLFTLSYAVFHFAAVLVLRQRFAKDTHFVHLLVGMVLSFITLAIPLQLKGHVITLFWAAEGVLVLYLARRTRVTLLEVGGHIVSALSIVGLIWDLVMIYGLNRPEMLVLFNQGVMTTLFVGGAFLLTWLLRRDRHKEGDPTNVFWYGSLLVLFAGLLCEVTFQASRRIYFDAAPLVAGYFFAAGYSALLTLVARLRRDRILSILMMITGWLMAAGYLVAVVPALSGYVERPEVYSLHWWSLPTVGLLLLGSIFTLPRVVEMREPGGIAGIWVSVVAYLLLASSELTLILTGAGMDDLTALKVGLTLLWGISASAMIVLGLKRKLLHLRIAALGLFAVTIVKLFVLDIRGIETGGKIAAFIGLGVLLLSISFLYQKLRFLLVDESREAAEASSEKSA